MQNPFPRFDGFTYAPAIPREEGVTRRDPSPVIRVDETFYVWYSRTTETAHGYTPDSAATEAPHPTRHAPAAHCCEGLRAWDWH
jgi:hypothetical protein